MKIITNYESFLNDYEELIKMFYPSLELDKIDGQGEINLDYSKKQLCTNIKIDVDDKSVSTQKCDLMPACKNELDEKKYQKRFSKLVLYNAFSKLTGKTLPWGSLTGIRPTRLARELIENGTPDYLIKEYMMSCYGVSEKKAELVSKTVKNQTCIIKNDNLIDIYVNIPFCPSRCAYCSFLSAEYSRVKDLMPQYVDALIKEIKAVKKIIFEKSLVVRTIYVGGGTPTVLEPQLLEKLLSELAYPINEFTVECGRPDTITKEKLDVLKTAGVTRICINPQSFNDKTLKNIGRNHTASDIIEAYKLALPYDFDINMDLIAGLDGENMPKFKKSIDTAIELAPANITVHTLSVKRGSILKEQGDVLSGEENVTKMIDYAYKKLTEFGYKPYYMYRQKSMLDNQENIGYARDGKICVFNIDTMEETCSVLAVGANAISKRVFSIENRIERAPNCKGLKEYLERLDELINRKIQLFS